MVTAALCSTAVSRAIYATLVTNSRSNLRRFARNDYECDVAYPHEL